MTQATLEEPLTATTTLPTHGAEIPVLGFGTFELDERLGREMVETALDIGYRHVDTAQIYRNESAVGEALQASGVARDEVWVTTKVWPDHFADGFLDSVQASLDRLQLDAVDLLLLHWPKFESTTLEATLDRLAEAQDRGLARHVGVSNFTSDLLDRAVEACALPLVVNQVEYHPMLSQTAVLNSVRRHDMALTAYSPVAQGKVADLDLLRDLGDQHGKSPHQIALRWLLQQPSVTAIPRTSSAKHCRENFDIFDFALTDSEMQRISALARRDGRLISPDDLAPDWDQG